MFVCRLSRENEVEEVKNEGPKEMTLDEWKAMQDKERTKVEFNIRKPNEGADSQWKKGYVLHKSKSEDVSLVIDDIMKNGNSFLAPTAAVHDLLCAGSCFSSITHHCDLRHPFSLEVVFWLYKLHPVTWMFKRAVGRIQEDLLAKT